MVRLAVLGLLLGLTIWEWTRGANKHVYRVVLLALCAFFALRYGQGTDYLKYLSIYAEVPPLQTLPSYFSFHYNKIEIGFFYLISACRMLHMHFSVFVALLTMASFALLDRFIRRFSSKPIFSLTVFYAVYSLTYMESALRQMLAIGLIMGWVLIDWSRGKKWRAMLGVLVAMTMHTSAALLFLLPIFFQDDAHRWPFHGSVRRWALFGTCLLAVSAVLNFVNLEPVFSLLPAKLSGTLTYYYVTTKAFSPLALANRLLFAVLLCALAYRVRDTLDNRERLLLKLYGVGFCIYLLFMSIDVIASRTNVYFRILEVALLPTLLYRNRNIGRRIVPVLASVLLLISLIYVKDIRAVMGFSEYYSHNPLQYPYITVFAPDMLMNERYIAIKFEPYMNEAHYDRFDFDEYYRRVLRKPNLTGPALPY